MERVIYLDHNATTPCDRRVVQAMMPCFCELFANPTSRSHQPGRAAFMALEGSRQRIATALGARSSSEISFTSGATEANNLALLGSAAAARGRRHVISQRTEHASVRKVLDHLAASGWRITLVGVERDGRVRLDELSDALDDDTALLSLMLVNNETGTIQPVAEAAQLAHARGAVVHCDAAQAVGKIPVSVSELGVDLLTLSAHKLYGPKGIGALYRSRGSAPLAAQMHGGGQEAGLRSGTVNLPGVVGLATAVEIATAEGDEERLRLQTLRGRLETTLLEGVEGCAINGSTRHRVAGTSNLTLPRVDAEALMASLPELALSTGSACTSGRPEPSAVLRAMGLSRQAAASSIRLSVGRFTTDEEVELAARRIVEEATRLQGARRR